MFGNAKLCLINPPLPAISSPMIETADREA